MLAGSILTSSLSGSSSRRPMETAPRSVASYSGQLFAAQLAGGIDACAGLVDDHVGDALLFHFAAEQFGEELLGLAAGGAVADGHDGQLVLANESDSLLLGFFFPLGLAANEHDHVVTEQVAELVERSQLAAALEAGIDGQHAAVVDRRLQEQIAKIAGEDADGMGFGAIGQLAAGLALQRRQDEAIEGVARRAAKEVGVRMAGRHEDFLQSGAHRLHDRIRSLRAGLSPVPRD